MKRSPVWSQVTNITCISELHQPNIISLGYCPCAGDENHNHNNTHPLLCKSHQCETIKAMMSYGKQVLLGHAYEYSQIMNATQLDPENTTLLDRCIQLYAFQISLIYMQSFVT